MLATLTAEDFYEEMIDWVIEPCLTIRAALQAQDMNEETRAAGFKPADFVKIMMVDREPALRDLAGNIEPGTPWKDRASIHVATLKLCLLQTEGLRLE